jgi:hypothetical protein
MYQLLGNSYCIILAVLVKSNEVHTTKQTSIQHLKNEINYSIYFYALKY